MRIDRPDEGDSPDAESSAQPGTPAVVEHYETRDRARYYEELRVAVAADHRGPAEAAAKPADGFADQDTDSELSGRSSDDRQVRHADDRRALGSAVDAEVRQGCDRIREAERTVITPAIREIEAADADRALVGLDHRLKGEERLKEKVARAVDEQPAMTASEALSSIPDAIRFTFCYSEQRYAAGVWADLERFHAHGFEMVKPLKNSWDSDQYKGINTQWREPETGQRFEVQFHTTASFEAKQLTHAAYERLRDPATPHAERGDLITFQQQICAKLAVPPGATEIHDHSRETR